MNLKLNRALFSPVIAALAFQFAGATTAAPLVISNVSPRAAAAQLSAKYGVDVVVPIDAGSRITLTIDDADAPGMRLKTISALANALGLDFTKTYIVSRTSDGPGEVAIVDTSASIPFSKTTLSAREAMEMLAGVNDANVQIPSDLGGTVTLSGTTLTTTQAAQEIAAQTGTTWRLIYTLSRRSQDPERWGRVIGRTALGSPIVEMPGLYFVDFKKQAEQERVAAAAAQKADQEQAARLQAAQQAAQQVQQQEYLKFLAAMQSGQLGFGANGFGANGSGPTIISGGDPSGGAGGNNGGGN